MMITHPVSTAGSRRTVLHRAEDWLTLRSSMVLFCSLKKRRRRRYTQSFAATSINNEAGTDVMQVSLAVDGV